MPRPIPQETGAPEHDSFLDIVANIVGILIILVMVAGVRAKNAPIVAAIPSQTTQEAAAELEKDRAAERLLRDDVLQVAGEIQAVQREAIIREQQRDRLATQAAAWRHEIESRRNKLDTRAQAGFDLENKLASAHADVENLRRQRTRTLAAKNDPILIESYPTPLSKTVDGREVHFHLRGGRVTFVPWDELLGRFKADASRKAHKVQSMPEITETIGPVGGFRLRYTLVRREIPLDLQMKTGRRGSYATLKLITVVPITSQLGETLDEALAEGSEFRRVISELRAGRTTATLWTYPDSFELFRRLKKDLYRQGFLTAARPLPWGVPISGSPDGSKSAAE